MHDPRSLLHWRKIFHSQTGEDGVLEYILSRLPELDGWCCEFGAWDGRHLSNTAYFIERHGFKGVLIEADEEKARSLKTNMAESPVICLNARVEPSGSSSLDNLLQGTPIPKDFDLLSIDIDGQDYRVWEKLEGFRPKVVIVEINIRALPHLDMIHDPDSPFQWGISGTSLRAMTHLAHRKGYTLLAMVGCNGIFCRKEFLPLFHEKEPTVEEVFTYECHSIREMPIRKLIRWAQNSWREFGATSRTRPIIELTNEKR